MSKIKIILYSVFLSLFFLIGCPMVNYGNGSDGTDAIFLRHSTGGWIFNYGIVRDYASENHNLYDDVFNPSGTGVGDYFRQYNDDQGTNYRIKKRAYPSDAYGWENYPYDYWNIWVNNGGSPSYSGQENLSSLAMEYDVIVIKHCYPASLVGDDTGSPDVSSSSKSLENYQLQYNALKATMLAYPDTKFIIWTLTLETGGAMAANHEANARAFVDWVRDTWDTTGDNIYLWDMYYLLSNKESVGYNAYPTDPGDAHPSDAFNNAAGPLFAQRVIDVIEGRGDSALNTGEAGSVKGYYWNLSP